MKIRFMLTIATLLVAVEAPAQIYRCQADGIVAFSDRPCGPDAAHYTSGKGVSFIQPDEGLPALAAAAQDFIRERRERLARRERHEPPMRTPGTAAPANTDTVYVPWPVSRHSRHEWRHDRRTGPPPDIAGNDRYSPLSGPILGTRRDSWLFESQRRGNAKGHRE